MNRIGTFTDPATKKITTVWNCFLEKKKENTTTTKPQNTTPEYVSIVNCSRWEKGWVSLFWNFRCYLLSSGTLLPRTQLSCSWTDSGVVCSSAGKAAGGAGLWFLLLVREFLLREVMDGGCCAECCLWEGGKGCRVDWPWLFAGCSEKKKKKENSLYTYMYVYTH